MCWCAGMFISFKLGLPPYTIMTPEQVSSIVKELESENGRPIRMDYYGDVDIIEVLRQAEKLILKLKMEDRVLLKAILEQNEIGYHLYVFSMEFIQ